MKMQIIKSSAPTKQVLAALAAAVLAFSANAQGYTNTFGTTYSPFRYDFGNALTPTVAWSTNDANGSATSGSAELSWTWNWASQGAGGAAFTGDFLYPEQNLAGATVSFDIYVDPSSTAGLAGDYGYFQVNTRYNNSTYTYGPTYLGKSLVGLSGLVSAVGKWGHANFVLGAEASTLRALTFQDYNDSSRQITGNELIYIDNVKMIPLQTNVPTVKISRPVAGLNIFASTETSTYFDRQSAVLQTNHGLSWVGHATAANPVTYAFTINNFPQAPASYGCAAYLWLIPNPAGIENSPDYNETNAVIVSVTQKSATNAIMSLAYKVNEAGGNRMYYGLGSYTNASDSWNGVAANYLESGALGNVTNAGTAVGTWSVRFTSNTNVTLVAPSGNLSSYVIPTYNVSNFAETIGFNAYLGFWMNVAGASNQAAVFSNFEISGTVNPFSDNFLADAILNSNYWNTSVAIAPATVIIPAPSAAYWLQWTLPAVGFTLQTGSNLNNLAAWTPPTTYPVLEFLGEAQQLVDSRELPAGNVGFFILSTNQSTFTQLQVLLPGETSAPGTVSGKTGTPTPQSVYTPVAITINAVDANWNIVSSANDVIQLSSSDGSAILPNSASLVNGTVTFPTFVFETGSGASQTVTATDTSNANIPPANSSSVTVN